MPARSRSGAGRSASGPTDGHYSESYGRSLLAPACHGAAAGASTLSTLRRATEDGRSAATEDGSPTAALRPSERGWAHCKELTETPMLTPSGRTRYQISHCEKFGRRRGPEAERAGALLVLRTVTTRSPTDGHYWPLPAMALRLGLPPSPPSAGLRRTGAVLLRRTGRPQPCSVRNPLARRPAALREEAAARDARPSDREGRAPPFARL